MEETPCFQNHCFRVEHGGTIGLGDTVPSSRTANDAATLQVSPAHVVLPPRNGSCRQGTRVAGSETWRFCRVMEGVHLVLARI